MPPALGLACGWAGVILTDAIVLAQVRPGRPVGPPILLPVPPGGAPSPGSDPGGDVGPVEAVLGGLICLVAIVVVGAVAFGAFKLLQFVMELLGAGMKAVSDLVAAGFGAMWNATSNSLARREAVKRRRNAAELQALELELLEQGRSRVREILRQKLPRFNAAQIEALLDALKFKDYLRLPPGVSVKKYNPRRLGIDLDNQGPVGTTQVHLRYDGKMFIDVSVVAGDGISFAK